MALQTAVTPVMMTMTMMVCWIRPDVCPGFDDNIDVDGDGTPDGCDPLLDNDNDTIPNDLDVCPGGDDRIDSDTDGIPDFCDPGVDSDYDTVLDRERQLSVQVQR